MKHTFALALGTVLVMAVRAEAQTVSPAAMPQAEMSSGQIPQTSRADRQAAEANAGAAAPNGSGNVIPNGPITANPPGAGASSSAALAEHGEVASSGNGNSAHQQ